MNLSLFQRQLSSLPGRLTEGIFHCPFIIIVEDKNEDFEKRIKLLEAWMNEPRPQTESPKVVAAPVAISNGVDMNTLNNLLKDLLKKSDLEDLLSRLEKCEKKSSDAHDKASKQEKKHKKWKKSWI